jgi:DNA-binding MarR family transcriptional regulator
MLRQTQSSGPVPELKSLLEQVQILANQIKKSSLVVDDPQQPLAVGRAVLETLESKGPQTVPAIAERRNSSRQNVQIVVNRLHRLGLVELVSNPAHRRSGLVRITQQGAAMLQNGVPHESKLLEDLRQRIADIDLEPAVRLLAQLQEALAHRETSNGPPPKRARAERQPAPQEPPAEFMQSTDDYSLPYNLL